MGVAGAILMYHRIAIAPLDRRGLSVAPTVFRDHLKCLRDMGCSVVTLHELVAALRDRRSAARLVAITFDDGYVDALTSAAPILGEFRFPATFFVVGAALDPAYEFWWDALNGVFRPPRGLPVTLTLRSITGFENIPTVTYDERCLAHDRLTEAIYRLSLPLRDATTQELIEWSGAGRRIGNVPLDSAKNIPRPMTTDEVTALARIPGMTIGAHSLNHLWLPSQPPDVQRREVAASRQTLEQILGGPVSTFAYPYGAFDERTVRVAAETGFEVAVTTQQRAVDARSNLLALPRINAALWSYEDLDRRLGDILDGPATISDFAST